MRRGYSLYDSYRLDNSRVVPLYQGSAAPEALAVAQHLQELYDAASQGAETVNAATDNLTSLEQDRALEQEVRQHIGSQIEEFSSKGDWENYVPQVRKLGRYFSARSRELAEPVRQFQEWQKTLDDKDLNLTPQQKQIMIARARAGYQGLQKDASGRFVGGFSGIGAAKNVDVMKRVDEAMANMKEFKNGQVIEYDNQRGYLVEQGGTRSWVSQKRVDDALQAAFANDTELQSYLDMEGENAAFLARKFSPDVNSDGTPNQLKAQARQIAQQKGLPVEEVYAKLVKKAQVDGIVDNAFQYARTKYVYDNYESKQGLSINTPYWDAQAKLLDDFRLLGEGPNTVPQWANDPTKLTQEITLGENEIARLREEKAVIERQLQANPGSTDLQVQRDRLDQQILQNEKTLGNNRAIWNNTRDRAVQELKLSDGKGGLVATYDQFERTQYQRIVQDVRKAFPTGLISGKDGKKYSPDEVARAIVNGGFKTVKGDRTAGIFDAYEITMPGGGTIDAQKTGLKKVAEKVDGTIQKVNTKATVLHKDAVKNFSVTSNSIGLDDVEQDALGDFGISSATVYAAPGSSKVYTGTDIRSMRFVPEAYHPETNRITGRFKNEKGEMTDPMDVQMNSNLRNELRTRIATRNIDGKWTPILFAMDDAAYSGVLTKVKPGTVLTGVPDRNGLPTNKPMLLEGKPVELVLNVAGGQKEWVLRYKGGDVVVDEDGNQLRTPNITKADIWISNLSKR